MLLSSVGHFLRKKQAAGIVATWPEQNPAKTGGGDVIKDQTMTLYVVPFSCQPCHSEADDQDSELKCDQKASDRKDKGKQRRQKDHPQYRLSTASTLVAHVSGITTVGSSQDVDVDLCNEL